MNYTEAQIKQIAPYTLHKVEVVLEKVAIVATGFEEDRLLLKSSDTNNPVRWHTLPQLLLYPISVLDKILTKDKIFTIKQYIDQRCNTSVEQEYIDKCFICNKLENLPYWVIQTLIEYHFDVFNLLNQYIGNKPIAILKPIQND